MSLTSGISRPQATLPPECLLAQLHSTAPASASPRSPLWAKREIVADDSWSSVCSRNSNLMNLLLTLQASGVCDSRKHVYLQQQGQAADLGAHLRTFWTRTPCLTPVTFTSLWNLTKLWGLGFGLVSESHSALQTDPELHLYPQATEDVCLPEQKPGVSTIPV